MFQKCAVVSVVVLLALCIVRPISAIQCRFEFTNAPAISNRGNFDNFKMSKNIGTGIAVSAASWDLTLNLGDTETYPEDIVLALNVYQNFKSFSAAPGNQQVGGTYHAQSSTAITSLNAGADGLVTLELTTEYDPALISGYVEITTSGSQCVAVGGSASDPIISGFDGRVFDFTGAPNRVFNMFSTADFQVNSYFISTKNNNTYTGAVGVMQGGVNFVRFDLDGAYLYGNFGDGKFGAVQTIHYPMESPLSLPNSGVITRPSKGTIEMEWPLYHVHLKRIWETNSAGVEIVYIDMSITAKISARSEEVHGVIGQTLVNHIVGFEGTWEDYAAPEGADVFNTNFASKFYKYDPTSTTVIEAGKPQKANSNK